MAGFGTILSKPIHDAFPDRIVNTHPALLPAFKGWHAVDDALAAGVKVTGCTVHVVDEHLDHGPIIVQKTVPVFDTDDEHTLADRILEQEHIAYTEAIRIMLGGAKVLARRVVAAR